MRQVSPAVLQRAQHSETGLGRRQLDGCALSSLPKLPARGQTRQVPRHIARIHALAGWVATPVFAEVAKRAMAVTASGSFTTNTAATLTYMMHHQTPMFFSLLGTVSVSVGAWFIALARIFWQQWGESYFINDAPAQELQMLHGVDITGSTFMARPAVQAAADFASAAHHGQMRRTGDPYIMHCIETACIVEGLLSVSEYAEDDERAELAITAALLHDVVDDTRVDLTEVEGRFGMNTARLVGTVTQLSQMNQLMRRKQRKAREQGEPQGTVKSSVSEENELRNLILTMVDEPLAILIKLADRLHNMRTVYALAPAKAQAVALETLRIWCSLAERLGMFALKSELEDLCFAVLQPELFQKLRHELDVLWGCSATSPVPPVTVAKQPQSSTTGSPVMPRRLLGKAVSKDRKRWSNNPFRLDATGVEASTSAILSQQVQDGASADSSDEEFFSGEAAWQVGDVAARQLRLSREQRKIKQLVESVEAFDQVAFKSHQRVIATDARRRGLDIIDGCGRQLLQELQLNGDCTGLDITIQGRLKSIYSTHKKMQRKKCKLEEVYDARALRVVIDDGGDRNSEEAIQACYQVRTAVARLWKPIAGERDDYIANPKGSGMYQSLHMAVTGPGGVPMEVQLRTSSMHADAEYGAAAHWVYKEAPPPSLNRPPSATSSDVWVGQPVLRVGADGALLDGVIMAVERGGQQLLVAVARRGRLQGAAGSARGDATAYKRLASYIECKNWDMAGQSDSIACLQMYVKCRDGAYHMEDAYGYKWPTTVVPLKDLPVKQVTVPLAAPPKRRLTVEPATSPSPLSQMAGSVPGGSNLAPAEDAAAAQRDCTETTVMRKTRLLRAVLEWGKELDFDSAGIPAVPVGAPPNSDIMVIMWPPGEFKRLPRGTTAGYVIETHGLLQLSDRERTGMVNVNNRLVPENTPLADGDLVMLSDEIVRI